MLNAENCCTSVFSGLGVKSAKFIQLHSSERGKFDGSSLASL